MSPRPQPSARYAAPRRSLRRALLGLASTVFVLLAPAGCRCSAKGPDGDDARDRPASLRLASCPPPPACPAPAVIAADAEALLASHGLGPDDQRQLYVDAGTECRIDGWLRCAERPDATPEVAHLMLMARLARIALRDVNRALPFYARANSVDPQALEPLALRAQLLVELKRPAEAVPLLETLERRATVAGEERRAVYALEYLGRALTELGRLDEASAVLRRSVERLDAMTRDDRGYWGCPYHALGELHSMRRDPQAKADALVKAAELEVFDANSALEAAVALHAARDFERAGQLVAEARKRGGDDRAKAAAPAIEEAIRRRKSETGAGAEPTDAALALDAARLVALFEPHEELAGDHYRRLARRFEVGASRGPPSIARVNEGFVVFEAGLPGPEELPACVPPAGAPEAVVAAGLACTYQAVFGQAVAPAIVASLAASPATADLAALVEGFDHLGKQAPAEALARFAAAQQRPPPAGPDGKPAPLAAVRLRLATLGQAWAHQARNEHRLALPLFDVVLASLPDHVPALLGRGHSQLALGDGPAAEATFQHVLKLVPLHPDALSSLGIVYYNAGKLEEAGHAFVRASQQARPGFTCPHEGLGLVFLRQGRTAEARAALENAIERNPDKDARKYNALARIHLASGDVARARLLLAKSLANEPDNAEAVSLLASLPPEPALPDAGPAPAPAPPTLPKLPKP